MDEGLTIAEVAVRTGLTAHTLRYYERAGLVDPPSRGGNGHRRYSDGDLGRIVMLTRLRATGMSIADIRRYFDLVRAGDSTMAERRDLLLEHRARVQAQIEQLQEDLTLIDYKISFYGDCFRDGGPDDCVKVTGPPARPVEAAEPVVRSLTIDDREKRYA